MEELYFEWDERKRQANIKKHDIDFADVTGIFYDKADPKERRQFAGEL